MRSPRSFFAPLALGAPEPLTEIPVKPSRMIHFLDFSNEKMVEKAAGIAEKTDILLGNLEDAIPVDRKEAARQGLIKAAKESDFGQTSLWARGNSLESPGELDDLTTLVAKAAGIAEKTDILLGNLEDAIPVDRKEAARQGLIKAAKESDFGQTSLWARINSLESPWVLDDLTTLVTEIGDQLEVVMVPKVEGAWDIHYVDRLLAQLEAKAELDRPILIHAILETPQGVVNLEEIANASPRMQGMSFG